MPYQSRKDGKNINTGNPGFFIPILFYLFLGSIPDLFVLFVAFVGFLYLGCSITVHHGCQNRRIMEGDPEGRI